LLLICKNNVAAVAPLSNERFILIRLNIKIRTQAVFILILLLPLPFAFALLPVQKHSKA
jgi:hypothetical protein